MADSPWAEAPVVEVPLVVVRCPCGSDRYVTVRSMGDQGDGSRLRRCVCDRCSRRFQVIEDPAIKWQAEDAVW